MRLTGRLLLTCVLILAIGAFGYENSIPGRFERVGPYGGDVRSLLVDSANPDAVLLGTTDGQIYKSRDAGRSWTLVHPGISRRHFVVDTLVQHPSDPARIFAGAWDLRSLGGGLFQSRDSGASWEPVRLPEVSPAVRDFAISAREPLYMIAGTLKGVYVSRDGGNQWQAAKGGPTNVESVAINPADPRVIFAGTWRLAYRSNDFGRTWIRVDRGMYYDSDVFSMSVDSRNPGVMFAGACSGIYRSADRASSWTRLRVVPGRFTVRTHVVTIDPADSHRVLAGTTEGLFISRDDGRTWKRSTGAQTVVNTIEFDPRDSRKIMVGTGNDGVLRSNDGGRTWEDSNLGFAHRRIARILRDPGDTGRLYAGISSEGSYGGVFLLDPGSAAWSRPAAGTLPGTELLALEALPGGNGRLAATPRGLFRQGPHESAWKRVEGLLSRLQVSDVAVDRTDGWVFVGTDRGVLRARVNDLDFRYPPDVRLMPRVSALVLGGTEAGWLYAATSLGVLRSKNHGEKWEWSAYGLPEKVLVQSLAVSPSKPSHLLAGTVGGLYRSTNAGERWDRVPDGRLSVDVPSVVFLDRTGEKILAADNSLGGVFLSSDSGDTWTRIEAPEFSSPVRVVRPDPVRPFSVYLGTISDGIYRLRMDGLFPSPPSN